MYLFGNTFNEIQEVHGYTRDEILDIKMSISNMVSEKTESLEIEDFVKSKFNYDTISKYSDYIKEIKNFINQMLLSQPISYYFSLKTEIHNELKQFLNNLINLNTNCRNIKRLLKKNEFLENFSLKTQELIEEINAIISTLKYNIRKTDKLYDDEIFLWIESNKIKNLNFKLDDVPKELQSWEEIDGIFTFITSLIEVKTGKKVKSHKEIILDFHFDELYQYFLSKPEKRIDAYNDLIYLLYINKVFKEYESEKEFINVLERKEIAKNLKKKLRPVIITLIQDKIEDNINEILELDKQYDLEGKGQKGKLNIKTLMEQKFSDFLPKIIDLYFKGLDKKFQFIINDLKGDSAEEFIKTVNSYYEKIDIFSSKIDEIDSWILRFDYFIKPYENITNTLKKTIVNLSSEIFRRKSEYMSYLESVRDEGLRVDIRKYVDEKISEVNSMISIYEDQTSFLIREELPQLKQIRELLSDYKTKIENIKKEVYDKLDTFKENNIEMYQIIKHWEDNFNRKKQQLTFLLTVLLNKIFKSFKDLIDQESILFAEITEITKQTENFEGMPINFALSAFLAERLTEDELRERISEINAKINQLTSSLGLYQVELSKMEEILSNKVKLREGVSVSNVQCTVCHNFINFAKDKVITCPFCGSTYHYLCVAHWLERYNSCPMCQNQFLDPNLGLFETE